VARTVVFLVLVNNAKTSTSIADVALLEAIFCCCGLHLSLIHFIEKSNRVRFFPCLRDLLGLGSNRFHKIRVLARKIQTLVDVFVEDVKLLVAINAAPGIDPAPTVFAATGHLVGPFDFV
jgi:hypothetical protein